MALVMHAKAPGSITWDEGEVEDINMYQLCLLINKTPEEIEALPIKHFEGLLATKAANDEIEADRAKKRAARQRRAGRGRRK